MLSGRLQEPTASPVPIVDIDVLTFTVLHQGARSSVLTPRELQIMVRLCQEPEKKLTRLSLLKSVWGDSMMSGNALDVHLYNLRRKLAPLELRILFVPPNQYSLSAADRPATDIAISA